MISSCLLANQPIIDYPRNRNSPCPKQSKRLLPFSASQPPDERPNTVPEPTDAAGADGAGERRAAGAADGKGGPRDLAGAAWWRFFFFCLNVFSGVSWCFYVFFDFLSVFFPSIGFGVRVVVRFSKALIKGACFSGFSRVFYGFPCFFLVFLRSWALLGFARACWPPAKKLKQSCCSFLGQARG